MLKNKEWRYLIVIEILLLFFFLFLGFLYKKKIDFMYQQELIKNNEYMISAVLHSHPELEEEIIDSILSFQGDFQKGKQILEKYGLDQTETVYQLEQFHQLKYNLTLDMILFILFLFLVLTLSYFIFFKKWYRKLKQLSDYMNQVLNDNYNLDIKDYEEGDISTLKNDIYKLTIKLKEGRDQSLQDKKELEQILSDISHQIKTPLTSMYVINDLLKKDDIDSDTKKSFLEKNQHQLERMEWLVTTLLKISRLDSGTVKIKQKNVNIKTVIDKALEPVQIPIELKEIKVETIGVMPKVYLDPEWTVEVFVNVLKNAYEHTPKKGRITISVIDNPLYTEVSIHDTGTGIKKEELPHIFERFYTGSSNKESIGVGLNMAKKIMEKQSGEIYATSIEKEGTTFFIKFYKHIV